MKNYGEEAGFFDLLKLYRISECSHRSRSAAAAYCCGWEVPSILSIEHAFNVSALAQHTSFETRNNVSYASLLADTIRHKYLNNMPIRNADKIKELLLQLSANPENRSLADEIMQLIKAE